MIDPTALSTPTVVVASSTPASLTTPQASELNPFRDIVSHKVKYLSIPDFVDILDGGEDEEGNSCRNPDNDPAGPWCYYGAGAKGYCDIPLCPGQYIRHVLVPGSSYACSM